jgi:CRP-like cAMP-binding protein
MISPELLRRYPFFGFLDDTQLKAVAMIAEDMRLKQGELLFEADTPASALYLIVDGRVDFLYVVADRDDLKLHKEFYLGEHGPGEIIGISALIEPYVYSTTARVTSPGCDVVRIEGAGLRALCEVDSKLAYGLMRQTAKLAMERLHDTRTLLAAARA